ncbi:cytosine deaminase [Oscillatoria sp. CS-180]|uniref:cytosine deaminase n=1 Tax=Oscillatoria sp. CS-180 TaxID=3021720 RepID=UPI00232E81D1|nr:cytosine deaminase [Oscillatoria sp. CS-180]MDB9525610.1 cytosine deaminase [Oscillatoria sp. CS-180]
MSIAPFITPPQANHFWLVNARIPLIFLDETVPHRTVLPNLACPPFSEDLVAADLEIEAGRIVAIAPLNTAPPEAPAVDLAQGIVFPCFVDLHTHLDKGQMLPRQANPDGTFQRALQAVREDYPNWTADDLYQRIEFGLKCSYAHGTKAIRTHFDAFGGMAKTALEVFSKLKHYWADRLTLQTVCLVSLDYYLEDEGEALANLVAEYGGILGGVAYPNPDLTDQLDRLFTLATDRNLAIDLHVDESLNPDDMALRHIAQAKLRHQFSAPVVCGHCCSLSVQSTDAVDETIRWVKEADIGIVSLPMCNLYLQDRQSDRTPRYRGVTLLHELKQQGIPVAIASDNCRDPFHAYGDHDALEVLTDSTRIAHLDRPIADWPLAMTRTPADLMGLTDTGRIGIGQGADLVLFKARSFNELLCRPQSDRAVLRQGQAINTTPPDYAELDHLYK